MFPSDSKILVVDDSSFARTFLKNGCQELGYSQVLEAPDAKAAQALIVEADKHGAPVHLLITDLHMPDMTGLDLIKWLRAQEKWKFLPIIVLTSSQEKREVLEAGLAGVSHYMIKPFDIPVLKEKIASTWLKHGQKFYGSTKGQNPAGG